MPESLDVPAKAGQPPRGETTDAAAAQRSECVMLNRDLIFSKRSEPLTTSWGTGGRGAAQEPDADAPLHRGTASSASAVRAFDHEPRGGEVSWLEQQVAQPAPSGLDAVARKDNRD